LAIVTFPAFYDPTRIGTLFYPDVAAIAADAAAASLSAAAEDAQDLHLVIIDMQVDFCHRQGNLNVPGSLEDIRRTIEFIYRNAARITHITCSLDSHLPAQIFTPAWWADAAGNHPAPFTIITWADVQAGTWRPLVEPEASVRYVNQLEQQHKKQLCIWPYHVQIGSIGHALDPELWSAVFWHSLARKTQPHWLAKGSVPLTEHYSILQPEVPVPGQPGGSKNRAFLDILDQADYVVIAGEAESHCVLETVEDLVEDFGPAAISKVFFLRDCTSPVLHPEIDFHALAVSRFAEFEQRGVNFILSTDPLPAQRMLR
jgi:nicotinamidase/pyrazinamidase